MKTYVRVTEQFGRGVYAETDIKKGQTIEVAEILALSQDDTWRVNHTALKDYTFVLNEVEQCIPVGAAGVGIYDTHCLVLGNGELYNHSDKPNASYELINLNGRKRMFFTALEDIKADEQIFIDYNADTIRKVNVGEEKYTINLVS